MFFLPRVFFAKTSSFCSRSLSGDLVRVYYLHGVAKRTRNCIGVLQLMRGGIKAQAPTDIWLCLLGVIGITQGGLASASRAPAGLTTRLLEVEEGGGGRGIQEPPASAHGDLVAEAGDSPLTRRTRGGGGGAEARTAGSSPIRARRGRGRRTPHPHSPLAVEPQHEVSLSHGRDPSAYGAGGASLLVDDAGGKYGVSGRDTGAGGGGGSRTSRPAKRRLAPKVGGATQGETGGGAGEDGDGREGQHDGHATPVSPAYHYKERGGGGGRKSPASAGLSPVPTGVYFDASRKLWRCQWRENGRFKTKGFSLNVYKNLKEARRACVLYRCMMGGWEVDPRWLEPDEDVNAGHAHDHHDGADTNPKDKAKDEGEDPGAEHRQASPAYDAHLTADGKQ